MLLWGSPVGDRCTGAHLSRQAECSVYACVLFYFCVTLVSFYTELLSLWVFPWNVLLLRGQCRLDHLADLIIWRREQCSCVVHTHGGELSQVSVPRRWWHCGIVW